MADSKAARMTLDPVGSTVRYARDTVTTAELLVVPTAHRNKVWLLQAEGQDVYVAFGTDAVVASKTQRSTKDGSGNLTADGKETMHIPSGTSIERLITTTHMSHISGATGGVFRFAPDTGKGDGTQ